MDIQILDLPRWSKYVLETPNGIFQPHPTLLENIFKIVAFQDWDWNDKVKTPDHFFFHGYINRPNYSKYYSLGTSLSFDGPLLNSFINKIRVATDKIGLNEKATPIPDAEFDEIDIKEQSIERHFSETLFWANQHLMIRPRPIRYLADQLSTYMSNEISLFVGLDGMHHLNRTTTILDTDRTNFTTEVLTKKLKVNSMKYNPMINPKDEVDIKEVNQFFKEHVSKQMLGSLLKEMEFGPLTIHQLLFTLNINQASVNKGIGEKNITKSI